MIENRNSNLIHLCFRLNRLKMMEKSSTDIKHREKQFQLNVEFVTIELLLGERYMHEQNALPLKLRFQCTSMKEFFQMSFDGNHISLY